MNTLAQIEVFVTISRTQSLSEAARQLGCSTAAVSRQLDALEADLQVRLFDRSTRSVRLSVAGLRFLPHAQTVLQHLAQARQSVDAQSVQATVRVCASVALGTTLVAPMLATMAADQTRLQTELVLDNGMTAPFAEGVDILVRTGMDRVEGPQDMVVRDIGAYALGLYASPQSVTAQGCVRGPGDLERWVSVGHLAFRRDATFTLERGRQRAEVATQPRWWCSDVLAVMQMVLAGPGYAVLPQWLADDSVRNGRLVRLLPQWRLPQVNVRLAWRNQGSNRSAVSLVASQLMQRLQAALTVRA